MERVVEQIQNNLKESNQRNAESLRKKKEKILEQLSYKCNRCRDTGWILKRQNHAQPLALQCDCQKKERIKDHWRRTLEITDRVEKLENNMTIDYSQQEELRTLAIKKVVAILGGKNTPAYKELNKKAFSSIWRDFKRVMDVNSYKNTSVKMFQAARKIIIEWQPDRELELMIKGANSVIK
ncbi:ORF6C domain-containing protein [Clostridium butyricum]